MSKIINLFWSFFCSLKLTIFIISFITFLCFFGLYLDQTLSLNEHLAVLTNSFFIKLFILFELNQIFDSSLFNFTILLLALNLIACSFHRLPNIFKRKNISINKTKINKIILKKKFITNNIQNILPYLSILYKVHLNITKLPKYIVKEKHKYTLGGVYLIHIALLFIMFGAILTTYLGLDGYILIKEKESGYFVSQVNQESLLNKHKLSFQVRCNSFTLKKFTNDSPMYFESTVEIWDKSLIKKTKIRVNQPLYYNGYTFYQSSYKPIVGDEKIKLNITIKNKTKSYFSTIGHSINIDSQFTIIPLDYYFNYKGFPSLNLKLINRNNEYSTKKIIHKHKSSLFFISNSIITISFKDIVPQYVSILSVSKKPLIYMIFFGFLLMSIGFIITIYFNYRIYYCIIEYIPLLNKYEVTIALSGKKNTQSLKKEFYQITKYINKGLNYE